MKELKIKNQLIELTIPTCCQGYGTFAQGECPAHNPCGTCRGCSPAIELFGNIEKKDLTNQEIEENENRC
ncbi:MAG: hypothetical protein P1P59_04280 [Treponemataceae bacterium]